MGVTAVGPVRYLARGYLLVAGDTGFTVWGKAAVHFQGFHRGYTYCGIRGVGRGQAQQC
jgi:hypothetical protein